MNSVVKVNILFCKECQFGPKADQLKTALEKGFDEAIKAKRLIVETDGSGGQGVFDVSINHNSETKVIHSKKAGGGLITTKDKLQKVLDGVNTALLLSSDPK